MNDEAVSKFLGEGWASLGVKGILEHKGNAGKHDTNYKDMETLKHSSRYTCDK